MYKIRSKKRGAMFPVLTFLLLVTLLFSLGAAGPAAAQDTTGVSYDALINQAVEFNKQAYTAGEDLNAYDAYVLTLAGEDLSTTAWVYNGVSLQKSVTDTVYATLQVPDDVSAKEIAYELLAVSEWGFSDLASQLAGVLKSRQTGAGSFDNNIYSDMPALEALGRAGYLDLIDEAAARDYILGTQHEADGDPESGSWGTAWGDSYFPDFMTTAQAIRALVYLPGAATDEVQQAVEAGLAWMRDQQDGDGSFRPSDFDDPLIDTAEVIHTLITLGVDPTTWKSQAGKSPADYIREEAPNADGSFGATGNVMDATWALHTYLLLAEKFPLPTVPPSLTVTPATATIVAGDTQQFQAVVAHVYGTSNDVTSAATWEVADNTVASISPTGLATGLAAGETVITATDAGMTAQADLIVTAPGGPQPGGGTSPRTCTVGIAVVGQNGEVLFGPDDVVVSEEGRWGFTALGALDATALDYTMSAQWEGLVEAIAGQANAGLSGWMYKVNDTSPMVAAGDFTVTTSDRIIWWYSTDMSSSGPTWADLQSGSSGNEITPTPTVPTPPPGAAVPLGEADVNRAVEQAGESGVVSLEAPEGGSELALTKAQLAKVAATEKPTNLQVSGLQFTMPPAVVKALAELDAAQVQLAAVRVAAAEAGELVTGAAGAASLRLRGDVFDLTAEAVAPDGARETVTRFEEAITVALPVPDDGRAAAEAGRLDAYHYQEDNNSWQALGGTYDPGAGVIRFQTDHLSKYALLEKKEEEVPASGPSVPEPRATRTFADIQGHWAQADIEIMAGRGIARGVGPDKFNPDGLVTRAEFAAFLIRSLGLEEVPATQSHFQDVATSDWYAGAVETAYAHGLVAGYGDGNFRPQANITREEIAALAIRGLSKGGLQVPVVNGELLLSRFADQGQISPWARGAVAAAVQEGIITGRGDNRLAPQEHATRAEAIVVLKRLLGHLGQLPE